MTKTLVPKTMTLRSKSTPCTVCRTQLRHAGKRQRRIQGLHGIIIVSFTAWHCSHCKRLAPTAPGIASLHSLYSDAVTAKVRGLRKHMSRQAASDVMFRDHGFRVPISTIGEWDV